MVNRSRRRPRVKVTGGDCGVVNHAGARLLADLAEQVGLTAALSAAMAPTKQRRRGHDRGEVLVDVAVMLADGGDTISDVAVLRDQPALFGDVASHATVWRTLEAVDDAALERMKGARAEARTRAWAAGADPGFYVIDLDATLVGAHSEKEQAARPISGGSGSTRCWPISMPPAKPSLACYGRGMPDRARQPITSPCWMTPWPSCRSISAASSDRAGRLGRPVARLREPLPATSRAVRDRSPTARRRRQGPGRRA
jgi:Transposase DDE domain group 1